MNPQADHPTFDRWMWTDLLGFDNRESDFGAGAFLENAGFIPEVISLLVANPEFIHAHDGRIDQPFPPNYCSYYAHPANERHERQAWSSFQLRGLVGSLQRHGVKVYVANFDTNTGGAWLDRHPEICHISRTHGRLDSVCPWKRLDDGTDYADFFSAKLVEVLDDYGFDGYHGADGYGHPRIPIYDGDFSDDMVELFVRFSGLNGAAPLAEPCDGDQQKIALRAKWIWTRHRRQWIAFYTHRVLSFWKKIVRAVHARNKQVVLNSAWTRDPFEAIYRYGVDYQQLARAGVDGFIVESAAAALETMERGEASSRYLCNFMGALLLIKAYVPATPLRWLNGVKDNLEQWSALRHAPTLLESEIYALANLFHGDSHGALRRCAAGPVVCLADALAPHEWRWLNQRWNLAFSMLPLKVLGATLIWSDQALANQLDDFIATRRWTTHRILHHLIARGAPIQSVAGIGDLGAVRGPIVVINPHLFSPEEQRAVGSYEYGPIVAIGGIAAELPRPDHRFEDAWTPHAMSCAVYRHPMKDSPWIQKNGHEDIPPNLAEVDEPFSWVNELYFRKVSRDFLDSCVTIIQDCAHRIRVLTQSDSIKLLAMRDRPDELRLLLRNDDAIYLNPEIDMGQDVAEVTVLSGFVTTKIEPRGSRFSVKVPLRGMTLLDVKLRSDIECS